MTKTEAVTFELYELHLVYEGHVIGSQSNNIK